MDKLNLKSNALAAMRAVVSHNDSIIAMTLQSNKESEQVKKIYKEAVALLEIEFDAHMKNAYYDLKEYFENG